MRKALPWELRGKLPIDPSHAVLRHVIAGEIYENQDPKYEVIVMAASKDLVNQLLSAAAKAKLDVVGMNVEPKALIDCFCNIYRRKTDEGATSCYVDIGCSASRAVIACGNEMLFARTLPVGGDHFTRAVADAMKISFEQAKVLRVKLALAATPAGDDVREKTQIRAASEVPQPERRQPFVAPAAAAAEAPSGGEGFALLNSALAAASGKVTTHQTAVVAVMDRDDDDDDDDDEAPPVDEAEAVERACREPLNRLAEELSLCRRYYEATFTNRPIDRLIFVGGEARQRSLCQQIAKELQLAAQVGDPMVRIGRISDIGPESGIDRRQPQPGWAVAIGLSMGENSAKDGRPSRAVTETAASAAAEQR
jgi:Tfp pilus assembly PilM family ATPase